MTSPRYTLGSDTQHGCCFETELMLGEKRVAEFCDKKTADLVVAILNAAIALREVHRATLGNALVAPLTLMKGLDDLAAAVDGCADVPVWERNRGRAPAKPSTARTVWACFRDGAVPRSMKTYGPLAIYVSQREAEAAKGPTEHVREVVIVTETHG